jgi:hypothetical protein
MRVSKGDIDLNIHYMYMPNVQIYTASWYPSKFYGVCSKREQLYK